MKRIRRSVLLLVAAVALAVLPACDQTAPTPTIVIGQQPPYRVVYAQTGFAPFEPDLWVPFEIPLSQAGKFDITVEWTFSDTWMYVYFTNVNCTFDQLSGGTCPFLIESETKDPKPRILLTETLQPGTYYVLLYNVPLNRRLGIGSENTEAVSVQIGLTVGGE